MNKKKVSFLALIAMASAVALSACGSNNDSSEPSAPASSAPASSAAASESAPSSSQAAPAGETKEITLTATNWQFDQTEIKAHKGDTIKLTLKSDSGLHAVTFGDLGVEVKTGETKEFTVTDAGTFEFHCSLQCGQGHDNMTGNLIVE
ncbi:cupredoxin domain-containing protein [Cohnella caldifontis]|uniref:cupredoxin domain-containing protein n=1 Tax=Cohnella caldifontis TaxID=3027471 RepID=UPI0023EE25E8|nr:cupredoxin domain-containing protein [Cohnella sp. YIM B05605]